MIYKFNMSVELSFLRKQMPLVNLRCVKVLSPIKPGMCPIFLFYFYFFYTSDETVTKKPNEKIEHACKFQQLVAISQLFADFVQK